MRTIYTQSGQAISCDDDQYEAMMASGNYSDKPSSKESAKSTKSEKTSKLTKIVGK